MCPCGGHGWQPATRSQRAGHSRAEGVTAADAAEGGPAPTPFVAVTLKVYATPLVSPVTLHGEEAQDALIPPGLLVTV